METICWISKCSHIKKCLNTNGMRKENTKPFRHKLCANRIGLGSELQNHSCMRPDEPGVNLEKPKNPQVLVLVWYNSIRQKILKKGK